MKRIWVIPSFALLFVFILLLAACAPAPEPTAPPVATSTAASPQPPFAAATAPSTSLPSLAPATPGPARPSASPPAAAAGSAAPDGSAAAVSTVKPTASEPAKAIRAGLTAGQAPILAAWQAGPHADTYGLEKGPNTYCAKCHSPANYDALSRVDAAPNCVSCKFANDPQVRLAEHNKLVQQNDWKSIGCEVCHPVEQNGAPAAAIAWRDPVTGESQPMPSASELCGKCHADTATLRHHRDLGQSAHKDFTCVSCHDAHSTQASCSAADCHAGLVPGDAATPGHAVQHAQVDCVACHDAAGLQVGKVKDTGVWTTWRTTELLGRKTTTAYRSHNLQRSVDCARCHFAGNSFGLPESVPARP